MQRDQTGPLSVTRAANRQRTLRPDKAPAAWFRAGPGQPALPSRSRSQDEGASTKAKARRLGCKRKWVVEERGGEDIQCGSSLISHRRQTRAPGRLSAYGRQSFPLHRSVQLSPVGSPPIPKWRFSLFFKHSRKPPPPLLRRNWSRRRRIPMQLYGWHPVCRCISLSCRSEPWGLARTIRRWSMQVSAASGALASHAALFVAPSPLLPCSRVFLLGPCRHFRVGELNGINK